MRSLFLIYLLFIALVTLAYGLHNAIARNDWAMAEWLINYSGGFVRRGLLGEVALRFAHLCHVGPIAIVLAIQLALYGVFFLCVYKLTSGMRWTYATLAILLSPATLAFQVLDPPGGFRKEILLFALMGLVAVYLRPHHRLAFGRLAAFLLFATQVAVLSHEPLLVYLPYLFALVFLALPDPRQAVLVCLPAAVLSLLSFAVISRFSGDAATAAAICASLGGQLNGNNQGICGGAILWIGHSFNYARQQVALSVRNLHYWTLYPFEILLTILPFFFWALDARKDSEIAPKLRIIFIAAGLSIAGSIPLFIVGADWGRWIYIHAVGLMLLVLAVERLRTPIAPPARTTAWLTRLRPAPVLLVLAYAILWTLPHMPLFPGRWGYIGLFHYLHAYASHHPPGPMG